MPGPKQIAIKDKTEECMVPGQKIYLISFSKILQQFLLCLF